MAAFRLVSLPTHGAFELLVGLATLVAPFVLGFGTAGTVVAVALGVLIVGLALSAAASDVARIDISAHFAYDVGLGFGLLGAAVVLAVSGDRPAGAFFAAAAVAQLALNATTRYSLAR